MYRKPNTFHHRLLASFESNLYIHTLFKKKFKCINVGDVNIDVYSYPNASTTYSMLLNSYYFEQIINIPTRVNDNSPTTIYHLIINIADHYMECGCIETNIVAQLHNHIIFNVFGTIIFKISKYIFLRPIGKR